MIALLHFLGGAGYRGAGCGGAGCRRRATSLAGSIVAACALAAILGTSVHSQSVHSQDVAGPQQEQVGPTEERYFEEAGLLIGSLRSPVSVPAIFKGDCVLVPATFVAETLGISVRYDPAWKRLTYSIPGGALEILMHQRRWRLSSGEVREFPEAPTTAAGVPFVPAELLGITGAYEVSWDAGARMVYLRGPEDPKTVLTGIRFASYADKVRVVFGFTEETSYQVTQMKTPPRLVISFDDTHVWGTIDSVIGDVAVNQARVAPPEDGTARAVLDFNYPLPDVRTFWLSEPTRFVVDVPKLFDTRAALTVTRGVRYTVVNKGTPNGPLTVDVLEIDLKDPTVSVRPVLAGPDGSFGLARVSELTAREGALAGINGVFHASDGTPLGLVMIDGTIKAPPIMNRTALGITREGDVLIDSVSMDATGRLVPEWRDLGVAHAIGGGPRLVRDGRLSVTAGEESFRADVASGRAPRTAAGVTSDGKLLLVAVTGRQAHYSIGVTLEELANLMIELGARDALNLDGGGSSTMVVRDYVMNTPSDGRERNVADAILVFTSVPQLQPLGPLPGDSQAGDSEAGAAEQP